jgi:putative ABC transport system ATP-binding protein
VVVLERPIVKGVKGLQVREVYTGVGGPYSLHIAAGECVSLRGRSGSGKSLLLRAIADLDVHEGEVRLDGVDSHAMAAPQWRQQVMLVPVESQWWLDEVGAHFAAGDCPWLEPLGFGPEVMGWQVSRLSSGEKQRLALARALMHRPRVLLLDEPTASLDATTTQAVEGLVAKYRQNSEAAVLWVSHDADQAARVGDRHFQLTATALIEGEP